MQPAAEVGEGGERGERLQELNHVVERAMSHISHLVTVPIFVKSQCSHTQSIGTAEQ